MPTDKRAQILEWLDTQDYGVEMYAVDTPWYGLCAKTLAALRAEVERHEQMPEWRDEADIAMGFILGCFCCGDSERPSWPCPTIERLHASLGLPESER